MLFLFLIILCIFYSKYVLDFVRKKFLKRKYLFFFLMCLNCTVKGLNQVVNRSVNT